MRSSVLVATWEAGLFVVGDGETVDQELANRPVRTLTPDGHGGVLAVVDRGSLCRRAPDGIWSTIVTAEVDLACCVMVGDDIYAGTDDACVLRVSAAGEIERLRGFEEVAGRDEWYAGTALVNGKIVGPPLGIRSIAASSDGAVLLANVHVGGIPRSVDRGATWQPTIEVKSDVHEVRTHPNRAGVVAAAAAIGLCTSSDGGATWEVEQRGLHALHCSGVAFAGDDILVSAAVSPFHGQGALYRRGVDERGGPLVRVGGGLPVWLAGSPDTGCIATRGDAAAIADRKGNLYVSVDYGRTWSRWAEGIPTPSSVLIV